jgi:hypothetical protein
MNMDGHVSNKQWHFQIDELIIILCLLFLLSIDHIGPTWRIPENNDPDIQEVLVAKMPNKMNLDSNE